MTPRDVVMVSPEFGLEALGLGGNKPAKVCAVRTKFGNG